MKILVIEDEQKVAAFIKSGLEQHGHEVDLAYDDYTGEKLASSREYHLILLDIIIPSMNGIELCRKVKQRSPNLPVLMLTALGTTSDKVTGFDAGADDYLPATYAISSFYQQFTFVHLFDTHLPRFPRLFPVRSQPKPYGFSSAGRFDNPA